MIVVKLKHLEAYHNNDPYQENQVKAPNHRNIIINDECLFDEIAVELEEDIYITHTDDHYHNNIKRSIIGRFLHPFQCGCQGIRARSFLGSFLFDHGSNHETKYGSNLLYHDALFFMDTIDNDLSDINNNPYIKEMDHH